MSRDLIDNIADGDNLGAEAHFNNVMINKVGNALERKREELAKTFVRDAQVVKDEEGNPVRMPRVVIEDDTTTDEEEE